MERHYWLKGVCKKSASNPSALFNCKWSAHVWKEHPGECKPCFRICSCSSRGRGPCSEGRGVPQRDASSHSGSRGDADDGSRTYAMETIQFGEYECTSYTIDIKQVYSRKVMRGLKLLRLTTWNTFSSGTERKMVKKNVFI